MKITKFRFRSSLDQFFIILLKYNYTRLVLNHKVGLGLFSVLALSILLPVLNSYAVNDAFCSFTGGNATDYQKCIKAYVDYKKMNSATDAAMQAKIDQIRNDTRHNDLQENQTLTQAWVTEKPNLANMMIYGDIEQRSWYTVATREHLSELQSSVKIWKEYDHNQVPITSSCERWKECDVNGNPMIGSNNIVGHVNQTKPIPLKPEMILHPSGFITGTGIQTWQQLQAYMMNYTHLNK